MECLICYEEFKEIEIDIPCKHTYHKECFDKWIKIQNNCPYCRGATRELNEDDYFIDIKRTESFEKLYLMFYNVSFIKKKEIILKLLNKHSIYYKDHIYNDDRYEQLKKYTKEVVHLWVSIRNLKPYYRIDNPRNNLDDIPCEERDYELFNI